MKIDRSIEIDNCVVYGRIPARGLRFPGHLPKGDSYFFLLSAHPAHSVDIPGSHFSFNSVEFVQGIFVLVRSIPIINDVAAVYGFVNQRLLVLVINVLRVD
jgi:hypothetical protein